jgi:Zn-dependent protease with chaperone function
MMNWGNLVAILVPIPFVILWFGGAMLVYALNRHHPNPRVGHFTQQAAYRFYGVAGFFTAVAAFFPGGGSGAWWLPYLVSWALAVLVLVPWTILDLWRIYREPWTDYPVAKQEQEDGA